MHNGGGWSVCNDADDDGVGKCAVRGTVELSRVWVLPERSNAHMSGICRGHRSTAAEAWQDSDNGSIAGVRHQRRRGTGCNDRARDGDAGKLQPGNGDDTDIGNVWVDEFERVCSSVLRRTGDDRGDDDV